MGDTKFRQSGRRTASGPFRADDLKRKREEGDSRNTIWRAMTRADQLESLRRRRGNSKRQVAKLTQVEA